MKKPNIPLLLGALSLACLSACIPALAGPWIEWIGTPDTRPFVAVVTNSSLGAVSNALTGVQPGGTLHLVPGGGEWGARLTVANATLATSNGVIVATNKTVAWDGLKLYEPGLAFVCVGTNAALSNLVYTATGSNYLASTGRAFSELVKTGTTFAASSAVPSNGLLHVVYGASGVAAQFAVERLTNATVFTLRGLSDTNISSLTLCQVQSSVSNYNGTTFNGTIFNSNWITHLVGLTTNVNIYATNNGWVRATIYPSFGVTNESVALLACASNQWASAYKGLAAAKGIPMPTIDGVWQPESIRARQSILFADVTQTNADYFLGLAQAGGFRAVQFNIYSWAKAAGSYEINTNTWPGGINALAATVAKYHAHGVLVYLHSLSGGVTTGDPMFSPPSTNILVDYAGTLAADITSGATTITTGGTISRPSSGYYWRIENEVVLGYPSGSNLGSCSRGQLGTTAAAHTAGAAIYHLAQSGGRFMVDGLKSDASAARLAYVVNTIRADGVYFDMADQWGVFTNAWQQVGAYQINTCARFDHDVFVMGSGYTPAFVPWLGTFNGGDSFAVDAKLSIDEYKRKWLWTNGLPTMRKSNQGWNGLYKSDVAYRATTPDIVEFFCARGAADDSSQTIQSDYANLSGNGRTIEMTDVIREWEGLRLANKFTPEMRAQLTTNEWTLRNRNLCQVRYDERRATNSLTVTNTFPAQPPGIRLECVPQYNETYATALITNSAKWTNCNTYDSPGKSALAAISTTTTNRVLKGRFTIAANVSSGDTPIANFQYNTSDGYVADFMIDLGTNTGNFDFVIPERGGTMARIPGASNYDWAKAIGPGFKWANVTSIKFLWARMPSASIDISLANLYALAETPVSITNPVVTVGGRSMTLPFRLTNGCYVEYRGSGYATNYTRDGVMLGYAFPTGSIPVLTNGANTITILPTNTAVKINVITTNTPIASFAL